MGDNRKNNKESPDIKNDGLNGSLVITIAIIVVMFLLSLFFGD